MLCDKCDNTTRVSKAKFKLIVLEGFTNDELRFTDSPLYHPKSHQITVSGMRDEFLVVSLEELGTACLK